MGLKAYLEKIEPNFEPGGKHEKWYALYEAAATIFYTPGKVNKANTHVRDSIDLKRIMITVWMATFPAMFFGMYNIGNQTLDYFSVVGVQNSNDWHHIFINFVDYTNNTFFTKMWIGAVYFIPIYAVTFAVGILWEILFAVVRKHEINEGLFVSSILGIACEG